MKSRLGWIAYFIAGAKHIHGQRLEMEITLDNERKHHAKLRTLLIGNCGKLPGGLVLIPDAVIDDGIHDIAAIDTKVSIVGWAQLFGEVVMQGFGVKNSMANKVGRIDHTQAKTLSARFPTGAQVQIDGEVIGKATAIKTTAVPNALRVKAPLPKF